MLEVRDTRIDFLVSESEKERLKELCKVHREPSSVFIRKALNYYIGEEIFREV